MFLEKPNSYLRLLISTGFACVLSLYTTLKSIIDGEVFQKLTFSTLLAGSIRTFFHRQMPFQISCCDTLPYETFAA